MLRLNAVTIGNASFKHVNQGFEDLDMFMAGGVIFF